MEQAKTGHEEYLQLKRELEENERKHELEKEEYSAAVQSLRQEKIAMSRELQTLKEELELTKLKSEASTSGVQRLKRQMERKDCIIASEVHKLVEERKKEVVEDEQSNEVEKAELLSLLVQNQKQLSMITSQLAENKLKLEKYFENEQKICQTRETNYEMKLIGLKQQRARDYKAPDFKLQKTEIQATLKQPLKKGETWYGS